MKEFLKFELSQHRLLLKANTSKFLRNHQQLKPEICRVFEIQDLEKSYQLLFKSLKNSWQDLNKLNFCAVPARQLT